MRVWNRHKKMSSLSAFKFKVVSEFDMKHLLRLFSKSKSLKHRKEIHQQIITHGLENDAFMITKLVQMYADCNDIASAQLLFKKLSQPNIFAWTALLAFYSQNGMADVCIQTYCKLKIAGVVPDNYVFPYVLRACSQFSYLDMGDQVHKDVIVYGTDLNVQVSNSLIHMYSKCGDVRSGRWVFDGMVERDLLSWNSMISGYAYNEFLTLAVELLDFMRIEGFEPDTVTWNTIMDAHCRMGNCDEAWKIFVRVKEPNIISWTILLSGYSRIGRHEKTLMIFRDMVDGGKVLPDLDCLSSILVSCRHIGKLIFGQQIHAYGIRIVNQITFYKSAGPALLTLYARCRRIRDASNVFGLMDKLDVVTWNAMILGFADLEMGHMALEYFREMLYTGIKSNQTTISTVLPVCDLKCGQQLHTFIRKSSFSSVIPVWNALIHMYAKCGCIENAYVVFSNMKNRDIVSWNTMIGGFAMHGFGEAALKLLQEMKNSGTRPNSHTFTSVLSACSHSGLVEEGLRIYHRMAVDFGFNPEVEHSSCVIDLLARDGRLEDAVGFIKQVHLQPDKRIWGTLLAASVAHQNIKIGMLASEHLVQLEPENAGRYVTLSNMYCKAGKWDEAVRLRKLMESHGLVKPSGYSLIESRN